MNKLLIALTSVLLPISLSISVLLTACSSNSEDSISQDRPSDETVVTSDEATDTQVPEVPPLDADSPIQTELIALIQTLESIAIKAEKKQIMIDEKMEASSSKAEDDAISKMTIELLQDQKSALNELPLTEEQLIAIRDKLVNSTELGIEANQDMMKSTEMTADDEKAIVEKFDKGQLVSDEAKTKLMGLIKELGIGVDDAAETPE